MPTKKSSVINSLPALKEVELTVVSITCEYR